MEFNSREPTNGNLAYGIFFLGYSVGVRERYGIFIDDRHWLAAAQQATKTLLFMFIFIVM